MPSGAASASVPALPRSCAGARHAGGRGQRRKIDHARELAQAGAAIEDPAHAVLGETAKALALRRRAQLGGVCPACDEFVEFGSSGRVYDKTSIVDALADKLPKVADHLDTYAGKLDEIKPKLADFEKRAQEFRDEVKDGVWVDATEAADANVGTYLEAGWNWATGPGRHRRCRNWSFCW